MSLDLDERLATHEHALSLIRDQVDELQIKAAEKKKPWYKQSPSSTSLLALLLSISTAIYSGIEGHKQDVQKKQESLRGIISSILDLRTQLQQSQNLPEAEREFSGGMLESKRSILAEAGDNLVRDIPNDISSSEYNILATDKQFNGNAAKAEEYLKRAVAVSQEALRKMTALRNLAGFYAQPGPFQDMNKARKRFQEAVEQIAGEPRDDATAYALGFTWEMSGMAEYTNHFPQAGREKIEKARKYYDDLSAINPLRVSAPIYLDNRLRGMGITPPTPATKLSPSALPSVSTPAPAQSPGVREPGS